MSDKKTTRGSGGAGDDYSKKFSIPGKVEDWPIWVKAVIIFFGIIALTFLFGGCI